MYLLGHINAEGYIYLQSGATRKMLHRETRGLHNELVTIPTLKEVKERREQIPVPPNTCSLIVELTKQGGCERLVGRKTEKEEVTERLQYWKGCYGAWPVSFN